MDTKDLLHSHLASQRRHVLGALDGLSEEQLRRPVLPSGWHCLGLVKHLALADEHYWFRCVMAGEDQDYFPTGPNGDWQVGPDEKPEQIIALYRDEIDRADAVIANTPLDAPPLAPDPRWADWGMAFPDLASVLMHVIAETAVHAGHLDATVEILDGRQRVVL